MQDTCFIYTKDTEGGINIVADCGLINIDIVNKYIATDIQDKPIYTDYTYYITLDIKHLFNYTLIKDTKLHIYLNASNDKILSLNVASIESVYNTVDTDKIYNRCTCYNYNQLDSAESNKLLLQYRQLVAKLKMLGALK